MARILVYSLVGYVTGPNHSTRHFEINELYQFEDDEDQIALNRPAIEGYIERKQGYDPNKSYLVLHRDCTFTMNFKG